LANGFFCILLERRIGHMLLIAINLANPGSFCYADESAERRHPKPIYELKGPKLTV
jgi:hypothetical protein